MVAAFLPLLHCPPFRINSTQTQVARNKWFRTNLLDVIRFGCARLKSGTGAGVSPFFPHATALRRNPQGTEQMVLTSRLAQVRLSAGGRSYALHRTLSGIVQWIAYESNRSIRMPIHLSARFRRRQEYRWCLWNVVLMSVFLSHSCSSS